MKLSSTTLALLGSSSLIAATPYQRMRRFSPQSKHIKRDNSSSDADMLQLSSDPDFHFEILRDLSMAPYQGADIGEVLVAANQITAGDMDSWYTAFSSLAARVHNQAEGIDSTTYPVSARNAYFREATYYRSSDFFLHGNWSDPRIYTLWDQQTTAFNSAIALLPTPGERVTLQADGFQVPVIFYGSGLDGPRPTLLICTGFDGSQEELYHQLGEPAIQRGWNVITFEGPGQPTVRRDQDLGFIPEWEKVVTPVVDYALTRGEVDGAKIGLMGVSFGGFLAPRAAAFEHRLAAVIAFDGIYDFGAGLLAQFGDELTALFNTGNATAVDGAIAGYLAEPNITTSAKWGIEQGLWAFNTRSAFEWLTEAQNYTLDGIVDQITAPVFVGDAQADMFFPGQAKQLAEHLGDRATYKMFESIDGAGEHCSLGAAVYSSQVIMDWFQDIVA
ncbi:alpha/beta-hydrolase [Xylariaceae sp. FL0016]|nr:alpha/beta-hydrolase [Xylariaceae sp. FL0016]